MTLSRRTFCGLVAAGIPAVSLHPLPGAGPAPDPGPIRLDNNENPYGPFPSARAAIRAAMDEGGRYPNTPDLIAAIARANGATPASVLLTVGATEGLYLAAKALTRPDAGLVTAAPSYGAIAAATEQAGNPVVRVPLTAEGRLDLETMAARARGAGVVYLCNPNNPTGTLITEAELRDFVARLGATSPDTTVVVGEAYHEYIDAPGYATAVPLALASPRVLVNRTFSKLYGLAGMRLGYLIGREETLKRVGVNRVPLGANFAAIAAATASLADDSERRRQRELNRSSRQATERFFRERGWTFPQAEANFLFVDIKRPIAEFRAACQAKGLSIGRPYPPADTWMRITIGTPDEMKRAFEVLAALL